MIGWEEREESVRPTKAGPLGSEELCSAVGGKGLLERGGSVAPPDVVGAMLT